MTVMLPRARGDQCGVRGRCGLSEKPLSTDVWQSVRPLVGPPRLHLRRVHLESPHGGCVPCGCCRREVTGRLHDRELGTGPATDSPRGGNPIS